MHSPSPVDAEERRHWQTRPADPWAAGAWEACPAFVEPEAERVERLRREGKHPADRNPAPPSTGEVRTNFSPDFSETPEADRLDRMTTEDVVAAAEALTPERGDQYLEPRDYVATNLLAHIDKMPDTGDWHGQLRIWAQTNSTGGLPPNADTSAPSSTGERGECPTCGSNDPTMIRNEKGGIAQWHPARLCPDPFHTPAPPTEAVDLPPFALDFARCRGDVARLTTALATAERELERERQRAEADLKCAICGTALKSGDPLDPDYYCPTCQERERGLREALERATEVVEEIWPALRNPQHTRHEKAPNAGRKLRHIAEDARSALQAPNPPPSDDSSEPQEQEGADVPRCPEHGWQLGGVDGPSGEFCFCGRALEMVPMVPASKAEAAFLVEAREVQRHRDAFIVAHDDKLAAEERERKLREALLSLVGLIDYLDDRLREIEAIGPESAWYPCCGGPRPQRGNPSFTGQHRTGCPVENGLVAIGACDDYRSALQASNPLTER